MKKTIGWIVAVFAAILITASIVGNNTDNTPTSGNDIEYRAPVDNNASEREFCLNKAQEISDLYTEYSSLLPSVSTRTEIRAAINTGRALVDVSRLWLTRCDQYFPSKAATIRADVNDFENALDDLENLL